MADSKNTFPEEIVATSKAFTETLEMENKVFTVQLNSSVDMTLRALAELIVLCKEAVAIGNIGNAAHAQQKVADAAQQALADVQSANTKGSSIPLAVVPTPNAQLDEAVLHAVSLSYENAVNSQQQANILQQAATTQVITTIISVATATLALAVKDAEIGPK